jgi:hypothetical protein
MIDSDIYSNTIKNALDAYKGRSHLSHFNSSTLGQDITTYNKQACVIVTFISI